MMTPKISEELARAVPCTRCGAPAGQWCSQSRARLLGEAIKAGDWRTSHAARQRAALQKIVDDQVQKRRAGGG